MDRPIQAIGSRPNAFHKLLFRLYVDKLERNPILTRAVTSALLAALSDVTSQVIVQIGKPVRKQYSWRSTAAFATFSMVVTGPLTHLMYQFLEKAVSKQSQFSTLKKVVIDRLMFTPHLLSLLYFVAIMEGKSHREAWEKVRLVYWSALLKNFVVFGAAQYINMRYVPLKFRVLFGSLVALFWNIYLTIIRL